MKRLNAEISYKVPDGLYCNHSNRRSTQLTRCRFCTDMGKGAFTCVLHNEPLSVIGGYLIMKFDRCLAKKGPTEEVPSVPPRQLMKFAISEYKRVYGELLKQGIPQSLADKLAQEEVLR